MKKLTLSALSAIGTLLFASTGTALAAEPVSNQIVPTVEQKLESQEANPGYRSDSNGDAKDCQSKSKKDADGSKERNKDKDRDDKRDHGKGKDHDGKRDNKKDPKNGKKWTCDPDRDSKKDGKRDNSKRSEDKRNDDKRDSDKRDGFKSDGSQERYLKSEDKKVPAQREPAMSIEERQELRLDTLYVQSLIDTAKS